MSELKEIKIARRTKTSLLKTVSRNRTDKSRSQGHQERTKVTPDRLFISRIAVDREERLKRGKHLVVLKGDSKWEPCTIAIR